MNVIIFLIRCLSKGRILRMKIRLTLLCLCACTINFFPEHSLASEKPVSNSKAVRNTLVSKPFKTPESPVLIALSTKILTYLRANLKGKFFEQSHGTCSFDIKNSEISNTFLKGGKNCRLVSHALNSINLKNRRGPDLTGRLSWSDDTLYLDLFEKRHPNIHGSIMSIVDY